MTIAGWLQLALLVGLLAVSTPLLGAYLADVYGAGDMGIRRAPGDRVFVPVERVIFRLCRIDPDREQRWPAYAFSLLAFSATSGIVLYGLLRFQGQLPLNPDGRSALAPGLSFNTAVSFLTNTNWQNYSGESTMSHLSQMAGLAVHNFVSAAAGAAVAVALIRGLVRRRSNTIGNFWVDLVRTTTRVLLPLSFVVALVLVSQGATQNLSATRTVHTVEGVSQSIPGGPVASQEAIKNIGQNGGGPYDANAAHPFENPNPITNLVILWAILAIPFAFPFAFGRMAKDRRQGWVVFAAMFGLWIIGAFASRHRPDAVILDLGLPGISGLEVINGLRGWSSVPIIILSAREEQAAKVAALDAGADDYVTKPFGMDELLARLRAALRRAAPTVEAPVVDTPNFRIDLTGKRVTTTDGEVRLTPIEWHLVEILARNAGKLVTARQLLEEVWGPAYEKETNYPRVHFAHIRRKLEPEPSRPRYFITEAGMGYRFEANSPSAERG